MLRLILVTTILAAAGSARADATVAIDPSVGGITALQASYQVGFGASWRRPASDWWVRGEATMAMQTAIDEGNGHAYAVRAGLEHRPRDCGIGCVYYGVDLALESGELYDDGDDASLTGLLAIPRVGLDLGGSHVRVRLGFEVPVGVGRVRDVKSAPQFTPMDTTTTQYVSGFMVTSALVFVVD